MIGPDAGGQLATRPAPLATVSPGWYNNDPTGLSAPTIIDADSLNSGLQEDQNLLAMAGITPSKTDFSQKLRAILALHTMADTGAVNALAVTPAVALPAPAAIPDGTVIEIVPAFTNTSGTVTLAVSGGSAEPVTDPLGNAPASGDIVAGWPTRFMKRTVSSAPVWWLLRAPSARLLAGQTVRLTANLASPGTSVAIAADEISVSAALGGAGYAIGNFNQTLNIAGTGAGGMDTGSAPVSGFIAIYAGLNPATGARTVFGTVQCQTTVYTGANLPAGYTQTGLLHIWPTNGSGQLVAGAIVDRKFSYTGGVQPQVLTTSSATTATGISLAAAVPPAARSVIAYVSAIETASITTTSDAYFGTTAGLGYTLPLQAAGAQGGYTLEIPIVTPQTMYYEVAHSSVEASVNVVGYTV